MRYKLTAEGKRVYQTGECLQRRWSLPLCLCC